MTEAQDEKELILGNKQLISLFFVVVALCGVCFAMGYIIGRNSSKPAAAADAPPAAASAAARPQNSEPPREAGEAPADSSSPAAQDSPADTSAQTTPAAVTTAASDQVTTHPGRDVPEAPRAREPEPAAQSAATEPGGSYLQVGAVSKVDAENLVKTLREQKLPALMQESPRKGLYRVLVGPYRQTADLAEAKARLKTLGFDNAFVQK
ncbi:MAG TPA: SPOR domain-containing protein [Bryobacteraceae bacterium]|nr:SPOR domain-containing protein [Bryobacteraceae bacterium]